MSTITAPLVAELRHEGRTTRRVLERVPEDRLDWRPHPKSMTLGQLALHVALLPGNIAKMVAGDGMDFAAIPAQPAQAESRDQLLAAHDGGIEAMTALLGGLSDDAAAAPWRLTRGGREVFTLPRAGVVRTLAMNHLYHHRGQLTVYLRLLDVPVPAVYGRSADEDPSAPPGGA